jgi:hypothetical protein
MICISERIKPAIYHNRFRSKYIVVNSCGESTTKHFSPKQTEVG